MKAIYLPKPINCYLIVLHLITQNSTFIANFTTLPQKNLQKLISFLTFILNYISHNSTLYPIPLNYYPPINEYWHCLINIINIWLEGELSYAYCLCSSGCWNCIVMQFWMLNIYVLTCGESVALSTPYQSAGSDWTIFTKILIYFWCCLLVVYLGFSIVNWNDLDN